ncbi:MAG: hypothetical protein HC830_02785 [Bacteroidetes bacterium]|nr:hypothetical protein [Bacteroidota bacterium]
MLKNLFPQKKASQKQAPEISDIDRARENLLIAQASFNLAGFTNHEASTFDTEQ